MKYIIANWKSNKNFEETKAWCDLFLKNKFLSTLNNLTIIICPPAPFILYIKERVSMYSKIQLGAQDLSMYQEGPYTGEISAKSIAGIANYVILGHTERRIYLKENKSTLFLKYKNAISFGIKPIYCITSPKDFLPEEIEFIAYEPLDAIGSGKSESIHSVIKFYSQLKIKPRKAFIYGGSVDENNITDYLNHNLISGVLIGSASLFPQKFSLLIKTYLQNK